MAVEYNTLEELERKILKEPDALYSYADYLQWTFEERVELIKGRLFKMSPAPCRAHQEVHSNLFTEIGGFLKGQSCRVYSAPFDVRFPNKPNDPNEKTFTVVQPDICVVCDASKLDDAGCKGAPDLIVEILSPATVSKDLHEKYQLYEEQGVKEYWVIFPGECLLEMFVLSDNKYVSMGKFDQHQLVESTVLSGLTIRLEDIFKD